MPTDSRFSYLLDSQTILYPAMTSGKILEKFINATIIKDSDIPIGWTAEALRAAHYKFMMKFIWTKVTYLAESIAQLVC